MQQLYTCNNAIVRAATGSVPAYDRYIGNPLGAGALVDPIQYETSVVIGVAGIGLIVTVNKDLALSQALAFT